MMKSISRIRDYSVVALNRELATKHITEIVAITNQIPLVEYTPERILDESQGPGMWAYSLLVLDGDQPIADLMAYERNDSIYISILAVRHLQICPLSYHHRLFAALPFHAQIRETLTQLIEGDVYKMLDQIFYKPAHTGTGTNWHQDNSYFKMPDPFSGTAMWIALHDATVENGTIKVIPRALDVILEHRRDPESDHHSRCWPVNEDRAIPIEMKAGGALFFCFNTPHATGANATDRDRAALAYHFLKLDLVCCP